MELIDEMAREKAGMSEDWQGYSYRCLPEHPQKTELVEVKGAVAPIKTKGPGAGNRNWRKLDKSTERTVYITLVEHAEWVKAWEKRTGLCARCKGTKEEWAGWSVTEGTKLKPCGKCGATGRSSTELSRGSEPTKGN